MRECRVALRLATAVLLIPVALAQPYTIEDVALHATKTDCWTAISGTVYDLTAYGTTFDPTQITTAFLESGKMKF